MSATVSTTTAPAPSSALAFLSRSQSKKFPFKCHDMLAYAEKHGLENIVSWLPGGKGFSVHNHKAFCQEVLKATFSHSNFKSFEKQLNNWGFERDISETGSKSYSNPSFIRGRKSLCQGMTSKSTRKKAAEMMAAAGGGECAVVAGSAITPAVAKNNMSSINRVSPSQMMEQSQQQQQQNQKAAVFAAMNAHQMAILSSARQRHALAAAALLNPFNDVQVGTTRPQQHQSTATPSLPPGNGSTSHNGTYAPYDIQMLLMRRRHVLQSQILLQGLDRYQQQKQQLRTVATASQQQSVVLNNNDQEREEEKERAATLLALRHSG